MPHELLADCPVVVEQDVAWGDMDAYVHVNNVAYFRYFENARIAFLDRVGWLRSMAETGLGPIVASASARYRKPLSYPDRILVGVRVTDLQGDRVTLEQRVVSTRLNAVATVGEVVVVSFDYRAGGKAPIPNLIRAAIESVSTAQH